jgi:transcription-repair coupling factor (superfamily II helicase)
VREAVERIKSGEDAPAEDMWSPTIQLGAPVTIPEAYIPDLPTRLALYRRLSALEDDEEIEAMGAEIVDRFGPTPPEVGLLMSLVQIKALCRRANVEKLDAGARGLTLAFRKNSFANPTALVKWVSTNPLARVRPDMRIVVTDDFEKLADRLAGEEGVAVRGRAPPSLGRLPNINGGKTRGDKTLIASRKSAKYGR